MYLFVHSNLGNNNFWEIKINHKVSNSLMHSCCHNSFIVLNGFDPKLKMIQKPFENEVRKINLENKKEFPFPAPSHPSFSACWPISFPPSSHFSPWAGPTRAGNCYRLLSPLLCR
jgi:hypothetical protein